MVKAPKKGAPIWNWGAIVGALLTIFVAFILAFIEIAYNTGTDLEINRPIGTSLIHRSYDLPFVWRDPIKAREVALIYIDEESLRELGEKKHQMVRRKYHTELLKRLISEKAKVVVFDVTFFSQDDDPSTDAALAAAMKEHGKVIVASLGQFDFTDIKTQRMSVEDSIFRDVAASALCNLDADTGSFVRHVFRPPSMGLEVSTLSDKAAELSGYVVTEESLNADWINYFGPPRTLPSISYFRALRGDAEPNFFKGKTVFIGLRTEVGSPFDQRDDYDTPYTHWNSERMPGVEIHATQFLNLIHRNGLRKLSAWTEAILYLVIGISLGWGLTLVRPLLAVLLAVIVAGFTAWLSYVAFKGNYWWPWLIAVGVQVPIALSWAVVFNSVRLRIESKNLEHSLALHLSPERARQLSKNPELLKVGAADRTEISILFSDIANFSTITGRMHPEDLFKLLNKYFETTLECVYKSDGTVVKLIGDAIFAIWNAPMPLENHPKAAVATALEMRDLLVKFDSAEHNLPLQTRIGLHMGEAYVGNVGWKKRFDYTAIGDNINLASRLEGLNKHLGTTVLGTRDIQRLVEKDFSSRLVGHFAFKGIDRPVEVHEFIGAPGAGENWRATFSEALFAFQRKNFDEAAAGFKKTIELRNGEDGPSEFYLAQIDKLAKTELPESWAGEVRLTEK